MTSTVLLVILCTLLLTVHNFEFSSKDFKRPGKSRGSNDGDNDYDEEETESEPKSDLDIFGKVAKTSNTVKDWFRWMDNRKEDKRQQQACCKFFKCLTCINQTAEPTLYAKAEKECAPFTVTRHCSDLFGASPSKKMAVAIVVLNLIFLILVV